jgi:ribosome-binding ATPase YchF (GTP1/OBG family)
MKIRLKTETNGLLKSKKWQKENAEVVVLAAQIEADINELETFEERQMFLEELVLKNLE